MAKKTTEDIERYLRGEKFYKSVDNYCLGHTLEDAADIARIVIQERLNKENSEATKNV